MHRASAFSSRAGVVSVASSLVSSSRSISDGVRRQEADPPVRRQDLGEAADVDGALQAVERAQARRVLGCDVAVGVVLDDVEVVLVGQLQHAVRAARRQAVAGGVVEHAHADDRAWACAPRSTCAITSRSGPSARRGTGSRRMPIAVSRANSTAQPGSSTITWSPGAQQRAADDVQRMRGADGRDDVLRRGMHAQGRQLVGKHAAQAAVAHAARRIAARTRCSDRVLVTLRTAAGMKVDSIQSGGNTPMPGWGLLLTLWNMPRISAVASIGASTRGVADPVAVAQAETGWPASPARAPPAQARRGSRARRSRGSCALPPGLAPAAGRRRPPPSTGLTPCCSRALPHRGQASAGRQQSVANALGEASRQLLGQRL